jgi:hypothetical protein
MTQTLPHDFPDAGRQALEEIRKVHSPSYVKLVEFIGLNWGDLSGINKIIKIWTDEITVTQQSMFRLDRGMAKLKNADTEAYWEGVARGQYVNWREDFNSNTLVKYMEGMKKVKAELDAIHGNIYSIRGHLIAMVIEVAVIAGGIATAETVAGAVAAVLALIAAIGTWLDYMIRVTGDLEEKGRSLENIRMEYRLDRGGGVVSAPFKSDIFKDWGDWESEK